MSMDSLVVELALESSSFQRGMQDMNRTIRSATAEFKNSTSGLDTYGDGMEKLEAKSKMLSTQTEAQSKIVQANKDKYQESRATLDDNAKKQEELKVKVEAAKKAYEESTKTLGANADETKVLKAEYEQLSAEYEVGDEKLRNNVRTMENWETKANSSEAKLKSMQAELKSTNTELELQSSKWTMVGDKLNEVGGKFQEVGGKLSSVGKSLSMKVTAPLVALGAGAIKIGIDFESSMSKVQAMSGATAEEMVQLEKAARDAGETTSKSAKDAADGLSFMATAGWSVQDSIAGLMPVLRLSEAGNIDLARASSLVTDSMAAMGIEIQDLPAYLDTVAQASRSSNTDIDSMMEAYLNVGGVLRGLNVPIEDSAISLGLLANAGKVGGEAGKSLSAILTNLTAPAGRAKVALDELGFSAFDNEGNFKGMEEVLFDLQGKMKDMTQEQKNSYISMIAGKEHIPTLNALLNGLGDGYGELKNDIADSEGALDEISETMRDNAKGSFEELGSAIQELGLKIYDILKPAIAIVTDTLQSFIDKLNNMSPAMQTTIVVIGGIAAAIGPVLTVIGMLSSAIGGILTLFGTISGAIAVMTTGAVAATPAIGALATVFGVLTGPAGIAIGAIAAVGTGIGLLANHLQGSSIELDEWQENVSESTVEAAEGFMQLNEDVSRELTTLSITQQELTDEMVENLSTKYDELSLTVTDSLMQSKEEAESVMREMLENTKELTEEEKETILEGTRETYDGKADAIIENNERINEILAQAREEDRGLREEELQELEQHRQKIAEAGIKELVESKREQQVILEATKNNASKITAEQSAEVVKNSIKQRDQTIQKANDQRNKTVAEIIKQRDESGKISEEQAAKLIKEANNQRNETVKEAEGMHSEIVAEAQAQAEEHVGYVDWETGEVKSKWQALSVSIPEFARKIGEDVAKWFRESGENTKQAWNQTKADASRIWSEIKDSVIGRIVQQLVADVKRWFTESSNNIKQTWNQSKSDASRIWNEVKENVLTPIRELPGQLLQLGKDAIQGFLNGISSLARSVKAKAEEIASSVTSTIKGALRIQSPSRVMMELGKNTVEGFAIGMTDNMDMVEDAAKLAADTIKSVETDLSISPVMNVSDSILKRNTVNALSKGEDAHADYAEFLEKLNSDELERSKKMLDEKFKADEKYFKKRIETLKQGDKKQNAYALKYNREELSKLKERNKETLSLINERSSEINEQAKKDTNVFKDRMNQYDEAIKRLGIGTKDIGKDLLNQNAIVVLQKQRIEELTDKYSELVDKFGSTSEESLKLKKSLEEAKTSLINMGDAVVDTNEKIKQSEIDAINDVSSRLIKALNLRYAEELKLKQDAISAELEELDKWKSESLNKINSVYDERAKRITDTTNLQIEAIKSEIKAIDDAEKSKNREDIDKAELGKISQLEDALEYEHNEFNKLNIQKEINKLKEQREERLRKQSIEDEKQYLNNKISVIQEQANREKEILSKRKQEELDRTNDLYNHEKETLDRTLQDYQEHYNSLTEKSKIRAEAEKMIMDQNQTEIVELLHSYEDSYERAGNSLGERLVAGIKPGIDRIMSMIDDMNKALGNDGSRPNVGGVSAAKKKTSNVNTVARYESIFGKGSVHDLLTRNKSNPVTNNVTFNSPKSLSPSEMRRKTESTLRKVSFGI